jgi:cadmium resistance protein CadD (predicted permease)
MEYIQYVDSGIDSILKYNTLYTVIIVFIITIISVPELYDFLYVFFGIKPSLDEWSKLLYLIVYLLLIIYFTSKDPRMGILSALLFVSIMHKHKINEINSKLVKLMIENIDQEERLSKLEK